MSWATRDPRRDPRGSIRTRIGELNDVDDPEIFRRSLLGRRGAMCTVVVADTVARVGDRVEILSAVAATEPSAPNRNVLVTVRRARAPLRSASVNTAAAKIAIAPTARAEVRG